MNDELLTAKQAAELLHLKNERSVMSAWKSGKIPGWILNRVWIVPKDQLVKHIEKKSLENYREPSNNIDSAFYRKKMQKVKNAG